MDFATLDRRALRRYGLVDLLAIVTMLWVGELRHGNDPVVSPWLFVDTLIPFLVGWFVASYALGAYSSTTRDGYRPAVLQVLVAWFAANVIGQALRATDLFHGGSQLSFFLVMLGFVGAALAIGRVVVIAVLGYLARRR